MWDVAAGIGDEVDMLASSDTTWRVANIRLEFGPAPTIGALLASLSEILTFSRLLPYDLEFFETPEGTYMYTHCELMHLDAGIYDALSPLVPSGSTVR